MAGIASQIAYKDMTEYLQMKFLINFSQQSWPSEFAAVCGTFTGESQKGGKETNLYISQHG
jgi:hypothetical protein